MTSTPKRHPASYRDPAGFIFEQDGVIYRQVNLPYKKHYEHLIQSGLYDRLVTERLMISHEEVLMKGDESAFKVIEPRRIEFISYPYEWCHSQLRDAALLTLRILEIGLNYGMTLKDASPYNIQFIGTKPILIDTLSWEISIPEKPWIAYRQFCEMFLSPLAISYYTSQPINRIFRAWPEGVPIEITSRLLPKRSWLRLNLLLHIHVHTYVAKSAHTNSPAPSKILKRGKHKIFRSLIDVISNLPFEENKGGWTKYYEEIDQRDNYFTNKNQIIKYWISEMGSMTRTLDIGCNQGHFSKLLSNSSSVIALESDLGVVEKAFQQMKNDDDPNVSERIYIVHLDTADLSPSQGLLNKERSAFIPRSKSQCVLALAILHHLILSSNIPLFSAIELFYELTEKWLILEFVPPDDPWALQLISYKSSLPHTYDQLEFERKLTPFFLIIKKEQIHPTNRWLYKLEKIP